MTAIQFLTCASLCAVTGCLLALGTSFTVQSACTGTGAGLLLFLLSLGASSLPSEGGDDEPEEEAGKEEERPASNDDRFRC